MVKNPPANAGDVGSVPGLERSPGVGNGNPLQYSYLESSMYRGGAWWATAHGVSRSRTQLSNGSHTHTQWHNLQDALNGGKKSMCRIVSIVCSVQFSSVAQSCPTLWPQWNSMLPNLKKKKKKKRGRGGKHKFSCLYTQKTSRCTRNHNNGWCLGWE